MSAINAKVRIERYKDRIAQHFGHANEAGIGKTHGYIRIFRHELKHLIYFLTQMKRADNAAALNKCGELRTIHSEEVKCFG